MLTCVLLILVFKYFSSVCRRGRRLFDETDARSDKYTSDRPKSSSSPWISNKYTKI